MQRLFSGFVDGWPGAGLLLLRLLTGFALIQLGIANLRQAPPFEVAVLQFIGIVGGIFLLVGLWTPVVGTVVAVVKLWLAFSRHFSHIGDPWIAVSMGVLGASLAMIGPGAWSIDARLFGRRRIEMP